MAERRTARPAQTTLSGKIRRIEERVARLESHLEVVRIEASRSRGMARLRLRRLERRARGQIARAQRTVKGSVTRLQRALAGAGTREEVARYAAGARATLEDALRRLNDTMADSSKGLNREVHVLGRSVKAGLRAGTAAYRGGRGSA